MDSMLTRVMTLSWSGAAWPHFSASMNFAAIGPRAIPMMTAGTWVGFVSMLLPCLENQG